MQAINTIDANDQSIDVQLDGTTFLVGMTWNESARQFGLSLSDVDGNPIINGVAVVPNFPLLWRFRRQTMPLGDLMVIKATPGRIERDSFVVNNAELVYLTEAELVSWGLMQLYGRI
jgi:hypothetical protein